MKNPPDPSEQIETWVAQYLKHRSETVDAQAILHTVRDRLNQEELASSSSGETSWKRIPIHPARKWIFRGLLAASILLLCGLFLSFQTKKASAEDILQQALHLVKKKPLDRCYLVQVQFHANAEEQDDSLPVYSAILWTRGDRFWCRPSNPNRKLAFGRDDQDRVWVVVNSRKGYRFQVKEMPPALAKASELRNLHLQTLLKRLLKHYDLQTHNSDDSSQRTLIEATRKTSHFSWAPDKVIVEVDPKDKMIWKVVAHRSNSTVTFTLLEAGSGPDAKYQLDGHLDPNLKTRIDEKGVPLLRLGRMVKAMHRYTN